MLSSTIEKSYGDGDWLSIGMGTWLVDDGTTTNPRSVANRLIGGNEGNPKQFGSYIICPFNTCWVGATLILIQGNG